MLAVEINLRRQILQFLQNYEIITEDDEGQYKWHFGGSEYKVSKDLVTRLVNAIVVGCVHEGMTEIMDFQTKLHMSLEEVIRTVQRQVEEGLGGRSEVAEWR
ncbi:hypothetical protein BGX38DRAFT_1277168 [Terfezia claveryi]|nr:hypothetical protein BGX38DRAFT_1277168 [Terfezia claveryi]